VTRKLGALLSAAAEAMRRILIENARHKRALKEEGQHRQAAFPNLVSRPRKFPYDLIDLDDALALFESLEPQKAQLFKLRFLPLPRNTARKVF
jgi:hypothetical protein